MSLHSHDLRGTAATCAGEQGASFAEVMQLLRHKTPTAALRYQHATDERCRMIVDSMGDDLMDDTGADRRSRRHRASLNLAIQRRFNGSRSDQHRRDVVDSFYQVKQGVGGGIRINSVGIVDAYPARGSAHIGARFGGDPVREVGTTELWLPAAVTPKAQAHATDQNLYRSRRCAGGTLKPII